MPPSIRAATSADEAAVTALWRACDLVVSHNDPAADFRFALAGPASMVLVGEEGGRIIGSVMVGHDGHRGWLYYLAAMPERQGHGIGRAMVEAGERWLQDRGVPKVQLMIRPTNVGVAQFYERLGYEDVPRVLMAKWLGPKA
ncbi:GNAT family acetyltransferase [Sphingomonas sp. IC4-52]|uniref:GNAT family acetyltransferase n=1 Tax=Sphingomonas sp. IC4-52 TaxID=2887202 RepID=UPI001D10EF20|nr:GNAT family acetyltransferase [Sphingomonas sp. IC4-52]MCC2981157.1 GNAT family acetyltransferase [Sphingomonas sp. IC4-52]